MAVRPRQSAISVIRFGAMVRNGTGLNSRRRDSTGSGAKGGNRSLIGAQDRKTRQGRQAPPPSPGGGGSAAKQPGWGGNATLAVCSGGEGWRGGPCPSGKCRV